MTIVVIHGPAATGKTHFAERFAQHYACTNIVDDFELLDARSPFPRNWSLLLTSCSPATIEEWQRRAQPHPFDRQTLLFIDISTAGQAIGEAPHAPNIAERLGR